MDLHNRAADQRNVEHPSDSTGVLDRAQDSGFLSGPARRASSADLDLDLDSWVADPDPPARATRGPAEPASDLLSLLARQVRAGADRPVVRGRATVSWGELAERVEQAAGALAARGVGPDGADDLVVLAADAPAARLVGLLAVARLGAVALPVSPVALAARAARVGPITAAAVLSDVGEHLGEAAGASPLVALHRDGRPVERSGAPAAPARRPSARVARPLVAHRASALALDGPTVARCHGHLVAEGAALGLALRLDGDDVVLSASGLDTPLGLAFGVLVPLAVGAALLDPLPGDPATATVVAAGPEWFAELAADELGDGALERVRWCLTDDAVPREVAQAMTARHGVTVRRTYGRPESGLVLADLGSRRFHDPSAVGAGLPGVEVRLVHSDGRDCETGAIGEIALRCGWTAEAADLADGFDPDARLVGGELFTGDRGCLDDGGAVVLVGGRVALHDRPRLEPDAVRAVLADHPAVVDVSVTTILAPTGGRILKAVVVAGAGEPCDRRELVAWCRRHLPEPSLPALIEFRRELPVRAARPAPEGTVAAGAVVTTTLEVVPLGGPAAAPAASRPVDPLPARLTG
jgi:acyl-coenzyme A synthetase/AMP-(fatty) acid ligase